MRLLPLFLLPCAFALSGCVTPAAMPAAPPVDDASAATPAGLEQAAYRYLFENNASAFGAQVDAYCLASGRAADRDPGAATLAAFVDHRPRVVPVSACMRDARASVTATGDTALIFHIADITCQSATQCTFQGGYYEGNMSASQGGYRAEYSGGRWQIQPSGPHAIS